MLTQTSSAQLLSISLDQLQPHPDNPRLELRADVVEQLTGQISESGFGSEHALLVRPVDGEYQIISGHHRLAAAEKVGLSEVPCWVREMSDDEAFMQLVLSNAQGELSPLEIGIHALKAVPSEQGKVGGGLTAYAERIGRDRSVLSKWRSAASVYDALRAMLHEVPKDRPHHLHEISKAPPSTWPALVATLVKRGWTVAETAAEVKTVQQFDIPDTHAYWLPLERLVSKYLASGKPKPAAVRTLAETASMVIELLELSPWATQVDRDQFSTWLTESGESWDRKAISDQHVAFIRLFAERQAEALAVFAEDEQQQLPDGVEIRLGDFRHLFAADPDHCDEGQHWPLDGQVDAIITDPPYPAEFIELFGRLGDEGQDRYVNDPYELEGLAEVAQRILKPGGICAVMIGQSYLPEIIARMSHTLDYRWTLAYLTPGGQAVQVWDRKVNTFWKPILLFTNGPSDIDWIGDVTSSAVNDNDKDHHHWGQSESGMADLIERLSRPGQLVCDPFLGGGTTAVVCHQLGRRFVGCDVDEDCIDATLRRFATP